MRNYSEASWLGIVFVDSENKTYQCFINIIVYAPIGLDESQIFKNKPTPHTIIIVKFIKWISSHIKHKFYETS